MTSKPGPLWGPGPSDSRRPGGTDWSESSEMGVPPTAAPPGGREGLFGVGGELGAPASPVLGAGSLGSIAPVAPVTPVAPGVAGSAGVPVVPTDEQRCAINYDQRPLRIIAGAGTGKTMVMVERIAHLVATGQASPDQVLGLTFTNKAAAELKRRVDCRLDGDSDVMVTTYHGFGAGLVAEHLLELDLHPRTRLLNRAEAWQLLLSVFDDFRFDKKRVFRPGTVVNDALTLASHCADHLVDIASVEANARQMAADARLKSSRSTAEGRLELCQIVAAYQSQKRLRHLIDFDDQIRLAVQLLREAPGLALLLSEQRPFVVLDEYQDTNYAQRALLQLIYRAGSVVTAVGDDMQSIYAFRGAHLRNILDFGRHFPPPGELALTENRRSGAAIVSIANRIQAQVSESVPKQLTARSDAPKSTVECFLATDDLEEAAVIAADLVALGPPWSERAVLCRKRRLIPAIAAALEAALVPVEVVGASGLLDRPEVIDLVAWLELLADPSSAVALLRILGGPRYRLGRRDLAALARHVSILRGHRRVSDDPVVSGSPEAPPKERAPREERADLPVGLVDALGDVASIGDLSSQARARLVALAGQWDALARAAGRLPVVDLAELVVERTELWSVVGPRGQENLLRFLELAQGFAPLDGAPGLASFVDYLHLLDESEEDLAEAHSSDRDAVVVSTIHQAKGLEWDHVWIPGLAGSGRSRIFPDERGGDNPLTKQTALPWWLCEDDPGFGDWKTATKDSIDRAIKLRAREEEWRLFYVACTRARRAVVCSAAQWYPGPASPQGPSAFYAFIASQTDLVTERFRHEPPVVDPQVTQMRARQAALHRPGATPPPSSASQQTLFDVSSHESSRPAPSAAPGAISVTHLVSFQRCPRQYYWLAVRPLPRRASPAAQLGTAVHRWIEKRAGTQPGLFGAPDVVGALPATAAADEIDPDGGLDLGDPVSGGGSGGGAGGGGAGGAGGAGGGGGAPPDTPFERALTGLRSAFLASPYAALDPARIEAPFVLALGGRVVRGRIDAMYRHDGLVEVVDFKTGRPPADGDPGAMVQLDTYAVAAVDVWSVDPSTLRSTYCYLAADGSYHLAESDWTAERVGDAREDLSATVRGLGDNDWPATPGEWCRRCEWQPVCRVGKEHLAGEHAVPAADEDLPVADARSVADGDERSPTEGAAG
ncbi:MAG: ATP-dependent helicase UvrD/PcrA [Acidimicrobiaceae bacterium]|nr:ATP-dependent helicase UvrD/PcrA [Acidimicrobiaceae bacterium]